MSGDYSQLLSLLMSRGLDILGSIVKDSGPQGVIFVRIAVVRDGENKQRPSNRLLSEIKEELRNVGYSVEFLLSDPHGIDMEGGLRATLMHAFGSDVRNVFLSLNERSANVWLEAKRRLDESALGAIKTRAVLYLADLSITLSGFTLTTNENVPSDLVILKTLRQIAPATEGEVKRMLGRRFDVPSDDWMKRRLDALRKAGKVVWIAEGKFACSLVATRALGTIKGRGSPDIARLLALARKGR
ncbi:hypothetical protein LXT12_00835 [Pelomonas sp. P7]|uniref:Uncharacterized protein n=1 Tax=Pelomonas caseinilytica TaxID=2906763 RepID=A0ABS8X622_9BURK|nr:hypothetical protein [Pelomonas sp. P7]MCE4535804.1 hypothetical protein [Pelomonas sp. P7]